MSVPQSMLQRVFNKTPQDEDEQNKIPSIGAAPDAIPAMQENIPQPQMSALQNIPEQEVPMSGDHGETPLTKSANDGANSDNSSDFNQKMFYQGASAIPGDPAKDQFEPDYRMPDLKNYDVYSQARAEQGPNHPSLMGRIGRFGLGLLSGGLQNGVDQARFGADREYNNRVGTRAGELQEANKLRSQGILDQEHQAAAYKDYQAGKADAAKGAASQIPGLGPQPKPRTVTEDLDMAKFRAEHGYNVGDEGPDLGFNPGDPYNPAIKDPKDPHIQPGEGVKRASMMIKAHLDPSLHIANPERALQLQTAHAQEGTPQAEVALHALYGDKVAAKDLDPEQVPEMRQVIAQMGQLIEQGQPVPDEMLNQAAQIMQAKARPQAGMGDFRQNAEDAPTGLPPGATANPQVPAIGQPPGGLPGYAQGQQNPMSQWGTPAKESQAGPKAKGPNPKPLVSESTEASPAKQSKSVAGVVPKSQGKVNSNDKRQQQVQHAIGEIQQILSTGVSPYNGVRPTPDQMQQLQQHLQELQAELQAKPTRKK